MSKYVRSLLLVVLLILGSAGIVKGEAEKTLVAPSLETGNYKVKFDKAAGFTLYYKGKNIIRMGSIYFLLSGGERIHLFKAPTLITIKEIETGKEYFWERSIEEIGGSFKCKLTLLRDKVIWDFDFSFDKEFNGVINHYPDIFSGNYENILGCLFETISLKGKTKEGFFPKELPTKFKRWTGELGEMKLYSPLGLVIFKTKKDKPIGYSTIIASTGKPPHLILRFQWPDLSLPAGYKNHVQLEVSFPEDRMVAKPIYMKLQGGL
ncbi:hypothetical protein KAW08_01550 [bacterium]|nr:hypothetical protein [bacterium]